MSSSDYPVEGLDLLESYRVRHRNLSGDGPFVPGGDDLDKGWIGTTGFISYEMFGKAAARYLAVDELAEQCDVPIPEDIVYDPDDKRVLVSVIEDAFRVDQYPYMKSFNPVKPDIESFYSAAALKKSVGDFDLHPGNMLVKQDTGFIFAVDFHMAATKNLQEGEAEDSFLERTGRTADNLGIDFEEERLERKEDEISGSVDVERLEVDFRDRVESCGLEVIEEDIEEIIDVIDLNVSG